MSNMSTALHLIEGAFATMGGIGAAALGIVNHYATLISTAATFAVAVLTYRQGRQNAAQLNEMKMARRAQFDPALRVDVYRRMPDTSENGQILEALLEGGTLLLVGVGDVYRMDAETRLVAFELHNVGHGPALDLQVLSLDGTEAEHEVLGSIGAGESAVLALEIDAKVPVPEMSRIDIEYRTLSGERFRRTIDTGWFRHKSGGIRPRAPRFAEAAPVLMSTTE